MLMEVNRMATDTGHATSTFVERVRDYGTVGCQLQRRVEGFPGQGTGPGASTSVST
jgi:hypothetical protein